MEDLKSIDNTVIDSGFDYWYQGEKPSYENTVMTNETLNLDQMNNREQEIKKAYKETIEHLLEEKKDDSEQEEKVKVVKTPEKIILNLDWNIYTNIHESLVDYYDLLCSEIESASRDKEDFSVLNDLFIKLKKAWLALNDSSHFLMINKVSNDSVAHSSYSFIKPKYANGDKNSFVNDSNDIKTIDDLKELYTPTDLDSHFFKG